ncbi:MAG: porin family protein [Gammaproteobacteria bacterium]|nr:porin family protein [Gammaproteobacteria bacterium]
MFRKIIAVAALMALFTSAQAAEPLKSGAYIGVGGGTSLFDDDGAFSSLSVDDSDTAFLAFAGYKFFEYLSVEARYSNFGSFSFGGLEMDITAASVHAVGILPFGESGWELFGQMGLGNVKLDVEFTGGDDQTAIAGGIGVRFSPNENLAIGIQTDVFVWEGESFSQTYDMSVGGTALSIRFIF